MQYKIILFVFTAIIYSSNGIKVNMQGSLILGKDVMEALTQYMKINYISGRRIMTDENKKKDTITTMIKSAFLCNKLNFCQRNLKAFVNDYIYALDFEIERVFDELKQTNQVDEEDKPVKDNPSNLVFEEYFKVCLKNIKKILKNANAKITEDNEIYTWTDVVKKISAEFQETAQWFVNNKLDGSPTVIDSIKTNLTQEIITSIISVENQYQIKLCSEHKICVKSYECTNGLNALLTQFNNTSEDKVKNFVRAFYELLPETGFYRKLKDVIATEFQMILNDMSYGSVVTKDVFQALQKTVESRLKSIKDNDEVPKEKDIVLLHIILSDMDHIYSKGKPEPFYNFLTGFNEWSKFGGPLNPHVKQCMKDISHQISSQSESLVEKLINEVKMFLEITVDPEK